MLVRGHVKERRAHRSAVTLLECRGNGACANRPNLRDCGDMALRKLSGLICTVFMHSPVFRIGGDEFVVILKNNDYDEVDELVAEFRAKIDEFERADARELKPWERISAAIGFVRYDPNLDSDVAGTFRRADKQMYACKQQMKGGVAPR